MASGEDKLKEAAERVTRGAAEQRAHMKENAEKAKASAKAHSEKTHEKMSEARQRAKEDLS